VVGDKVYFEGFNGSPEALLKPKQKIWEGLQPQLFTNQAKQACFIIPETKKEALMFSQRGIITVKSVLGAPIK
jgi:aminoacyl tRNA synthase complex-interacting multifunctional protein 1